MSRPNPLKNESPFYLLKWKISPDSATANYENVNHELSKKMVQVLVYLAKNQKRVVTRNELIDELWEGKFQAGEKALNTTIWELRKLFETDNESEKFIQTIHRRGYKLLIKPHYEKDESKKNYRLLPLAIFGSSVIAAITFIYIQSKDSLTNREWPSTQITDYAGREVSPSPSPDGNYLAFQWLPINTRPNLFLKSLSDPEAPLKQITFTDHNERSPTWSPDGQYLAFVRDYATSNRCEIFLINIDTLIERPLGACGTEKINWSKDGKWLAYIGLPKAGKKTGIYLKNMDAHFSSPGVETIDIRACCDNDYSYDSTSLSWSPDSTSLALTRAVRSHSEDIYVYHLADATVRQITNNLYSIDELAWTQDNTSILFINIDEYATPSLYQVNVETGLLKDLKIRNLDAIAYSHDYKELYYYLSKTNNAIDKISLDKNKSQMPFPIIDTHYHEYLSDYSSAMKKILFRTNVENENQISMANTDGSHVQKILGIKGKSSYPSWSANGKYIAYFTRCASGNCINLLDVDTLQIRKLDTPFINHSAMRWANNDEDLLVPVSIDRVKNIWRIPISGEAPQQITKNGGDFSQLSSDRKYLYFYKDKSDHQIYRMKYPAGDEEIVINDTKIAWSGWSLTNKGIYYVNDYVNDQKIEFFDFSTKTKTQLMTVPRRTISDNHIIQYIGDENALLFTRLGPQQYDIFKSPDPYIPDY